MKNMALNSTLQNSQSTNTPLQKTMLQNDSGDFLIADPNGRYAGKHYLIEICNASHLDDANCIEKLLNDCAHVAGATVLHSHTHVFTPNGGISGVVILSESHISIHTWPEIQYASMDIFMCGNTNPELAIDLIKTRLESKTVIAKLHKRGQGLI